MMRRSLVAFSLILAVFVVFLMTDEDIKKRVFSEETSTIPLFSCTAIVPLTGQEGKAVQFQGAVEEYEQVTIEPGGGEYSFSNGVTLEVPADAVSESTTIGIRLLEKEEVEPVLQSDGFLDKYFLSGFEGEPSGLKFDKPIKVTLPAGKLDNPSSLPLLFELDPEHKIYSIAKTDLIYDPEKGEVEITIDHFSNKAVGAARNINPHSDCNTPETKCRCGLIYVWEESRDESVSGDCQLVIIDGGVHYMECPGDPETWHIEEKHLGKVEITPESETIFIDEPLKLTAKVKNAEGNDISGFSVRFSSEDPSVVEVVDKYSGDIKGVDCGTTEIIAEGGCGVRSNPVPITVGTPVDSIELNYNSATIKVGETLSLEATPKDAQGNTITDYPVTWSSDAEDIATVDPGTGFEIEVEGQKKGVATITAKVKCDVEATVEITVIPEPASVEIEPQNPCVKVNNTSTLTAIVKDTKGNIIYDYPVTWKSMDEGIVTVDPEAGFVTEMTGNSGGWAWISATCEGEIGWAIVGVPTVAQTGVLTLITRGAGKDVEAYDINNSGHVVGSYYNSEIDWASGFIYDGQNFTWINFPGAYETDLYGINDYGRIVGRYWTGEYYYWNEVPIFEIYHGFSRYEGNFTTIDVPGAVQTIAYGTNNFGSIVGVYAEPFQEDQFADPYLIWHGFKYKDGDFTYFPGKLFFDINDNGHIVGGYSDECDGPGFIRLGPDNYITIRDLYVGRGINNSGQVVGNIDCVRGFIYDSGNLITVDLGDDDTYLNGINDFAQIVGWYDEEPIDTEVGFVLTPCPFQGWPPPPLLPPQPTSQLIKTKVADKSNHLFKPRSNSFKKALPRVRKRLKPYKIKNK